MYLEEKSGYPAASLNVCVCINMYVQLSYLIVDDLRGVAIGALRYEVRRVQVDSQPGHVGKRVFISWLGYGFWEYHSFF